MIEDQFGTRPQEFSDAALVGSGYDLVDVRLGRS